MVDYFIPITQLVSLTASGDTKNIIPTWEQINPKLYPKALEAIYLTHTLSGIPRAINAFTEIFKSYPNEYITFISSFNPVKHPYTKGEEIFNKVYKTPSVIHKLRTHLKTLYPPLEHSIIKHTYGEVFGRGVLSFLEIEYCVISVLATLGVLPQLYSHIRGAVKNNGSVEKIGVILQKIKPFIGNTKYNDSINIMKKLKKM